MSKPQIIRCHKCGKFMVKITVSVFDPGSNVCLEMEMNCRNKNCKCQNTFEVEAKDAANPGIKNHRGHAQAKN